MRRSIRILPLLTLFCMAGGPAAVAADGNGSLVGTVRSSEGRALIGAVIALFRQDDHSAVISLTRSDQRGVYRLSEITPGSYSLKISRIGYQALNSREISIDAGRTTTLDVVLQEFLDFISARNDPRNWDLKTVMRSTSDRRMIFRILPGTASAEELDDRFHRNGTLSVTSSSLLGGDGFAVYPNSGDFGLATNFAFAEPVSPHGRMIFSGQLTSGYDSMWRVRNTYQYRPGPGQDVRISVGYGRLNLNRVNAGIVAQPAEFFIQDPLRRDSGVESLAVGFQASTEFLNTVALEYGFDMSRINYGTTRNVWSPYFQFVFTPHRGWLIKSMLTSRRISSNHNIELPDGQTIQLLEPTSISKINNEINISQVRHSEISVARKLDEDSSVEVAWYRDRVDGPGTPFLLTINARDGKQSKRADQLRSDQDAQQGIRIAFARMLLDSVRGSIGYNYGTASGFTGSEGFMSSEYIASRFLDFIQRSYYHSITSQLEAKFPQTQTQLQATVRWNPGNPISTIDLFADRTEIFTKGMSFSIRQAIPLPEFMGCAGRWEALVDIRNPFDMGRNRISTSDGEISVARNPRTLRFGLNLNFF